MGSGWCVRDRFSGGECDVLHLFDANFGIALGDFVGP